jgi:predicted nucleic acid-binding protein
MIHGLDTGFLIAMEHSEHDEHAAARITLARLLAAGDQFALAPQVVAEFLHVVTDRRRFLKPMDMPTAIHMAQSWWAAVEIVHVFPDDAAVQQFFTWVTQFSLGRKRLLDTLLAATFHQAGIRSILTTNAADFAVLGSFECITPTGFLPTP